MRLALLLICPLLEIQGQLPAQRDLATERVVELTTPSAEGAMAPFLHGSDEGVFLTWLEPIEPGKRRSPQRLRYSRLDGEAWSKPQTIVQGRELLANWADFPSLTLGAEGQLLVHWLARSGRRGFAYGIELASSLDAGETWNRLGKPHQDQTATEHGFVSTVTEGEGFRIFWLDGREMEAGDGAMALRSIFVGAGLGPEEVLDPDVCTCCQTDAASTAQGAIVVYRDHSPEEIRDIAIVRQTEDGWSEPSLIADDGWLMPACPVTGPAVAAGGRSVAVAWYTAPDGAARVQVALSQDCGESFAAPIIIDEDQPMGRVSIDLVDGGVVIGWLATAGDDAVFRLVFLSQKGQLGVPLTVARTSKDRASGFPQMLASGEHLVLAWRAGGRLHSAKTSLAKLRIFGR